MIDGFGVYSGGSKGGYARVHVRKCDHEPPASVTIALDEGPWNDQLRAGGYNDWITAAHKGCSYALLVAGATAGKWEVRRIVGSDVDTTPRFVAIAAARAVWMISGYFETEIDIEGLT